MLTDIKGKIKSNTIIKMDFNTSLTSMDRSTRHKINKETIALHDTLEQIDLIDIISTFYLRAAEYIYFKVQMGHNIYLSKCRLDISIIHHMFSYSSQ